MDYVHIISATSNLPFKNFMNDLKIIEEKFKKLLDDGTLRQKDIVEKTNLSHTLVSTYYRGDANFANMTAEKLLQLFPILGFQIIEKGSTAHRDTTFTHSPGLNIAGDNNQIKEAKQIGDNRQVAEKSGEYKISTKLENLENDILQLESLDHRSVLQLIKKYKNQN